uniref:ATP synthase F0 subunit 8 n=2 Tax=Acrobeloides nanus TaxID=290746 RepID=A0A914C873_9BILA
MVDLKQQLDVLDYFGPLAVWICFFSIVFIISVTCILWCCVSEKDDSTVFAKWGMGPRPRNLRNNYALPRSSQFFLSGGNKSNSQPLV